MVQPDKVFAFIVQALEAETIQGQIATRVVAAARQLLGYSGRNAAQVIPLIVENPDTQQTILAYFN